MNKLQTLLPAVVLTLVCALPVTAEQYAAMDDYIVHYNAISTHQLPPEVARAYGITRSQNRAMLNVTVMRRGGENALDIAIEGELEASATNLNGQRRDLEMRLIKEQDAMYYVGFVRVTNEETLDFKVSVVPEGADEPIEVAFRQQFFTE